ncbi:MAG: hypothetical protein ACUZ8E_16890 [Candidatus Anammoxibacter sp.]
MCQEITTIILPLTGVAVGVVIGYYCSIKTAQYIGFTQASTKLICAFSKYYAFHKHPVTKRNIEMATQSGLENILNTHLIAATEFQLVLPKNKRSSFDKACQSYKKSFSKLPGVAQTGESQRIIKDIERVLQFTEHESFPTKIKNFILRYVWNKSLR